MAYAGPERRKHQRIPGKFVVSYRVKKDVDNVDISQTRNLGLGGMVLTTNKNFTPGTVLGLSIRLPFFMHTLHLSGKVLEIKEIVKDLIYDARIQFLEIGPEAENIIKDTVLYYLKTKR